MIRNVVTPKTWAQLDALRQAYAQAEWRRWQTARAYRLTVSQLSGRDLERLSRNLTTLTNQATAAKRAFVAADLQAMQALRVGVSNGRVA